MQTSSVRDSQDDLDLSSGENDAASDEEEALAYRKILAACLAESTAHALPRLVGPRPMHVKAIWLLLFCLLTGVFSYQAYSFVLKLGDKPETTTIRQDSAAMQFPDMFLCPQPVISGSYGNFIDNATADLVSSYIDAIARQFNFTPKTDKETETFIRMLLTTLPFRLLSDSFGHQFQQTLLYDVFSDGKAMELATNATGSLFTFYSPQRLNCFNVRFSDERRAFMEDSNNFLTLYLFYDAAIAGLYSTNPRLKTVPYALIPEGVGFSVWDLENGMSFRSGTTMSLRLVEPGRYPTEGVATVTLEPGSEFQVGLEMSQLQMEDGVECTMDAPKVRVVNSYTGLTEEFEYSDDLCWIEFKELTRHRQLGCVNPTAPRLEQFRGLPLCMNARPHLNTSAEDRRAFLTASLAMRSRHFQYEFDAARTACNSRRPCSQKQYRSTTHAINWPSFNGYQDAILSRVFISISGEKMRVLGNCTFPGYEVLRRLFSRLEQNNTRENRDQLAAFANIMVSKVTVRTAKMVGSTVVISKSYTYIDFISNVGGILGLYLGCSLLTLFELLELLHAVCTGVSLCGPRRSRGRRGPAPRAAPVQQVASAQAPQVSDLSRVSQDSGGHGRSQQVWLQGLRLRVLDLG